MSVKIVKVIEQLEKLAPRHLAEDWDNIGLQVGSLNNRISKILLALDATDNVIDEAIQIGANMIVIHHPMIFDPVSQITSDDPLGSNIYKLIQNNINLYAMHTNFDAAIGGTNDVLANLINLDNKQVLSPDENGMGIGRIGNIKPTKISKLAYKLKEDLNIPFAKIVGDPNREVETVAICSGSGMSFLKHAIGRADVFITGDVKFHEAQLARQNNIAIIDVGHYGSENIAMPSIKDYLADFSKENNIEIVVSEINEDPFNFI